MLNVDHFRTEIIRPVCEHLGMWSPAAENLVLGTGIKESGLRHLKQLGGGPALGPYQMEPATHDDLWANYLDHKDFWPVPKGDAGDMVWDLRYATAMCRIHYWRRPEPLPDAEDADGMGDYWRQWYNTPLGAGTAEDFARLYRQYVL